MSRRVVGLLLLSMALPCAARAQSLFATRGLGTPLEGYDARARAMSVNGVGLAGLSMSLLNPAEAGGTLRRGISATFQPWGASVDLNGQRGNVGGTRFPLITILYPVSRITFTAGFSGLLDQSWAITTTGVEHLGADSVISQDVLRSTGGIGQLSVGAAYMVSPRLSIGVQGGLYTGSVMRTTRREFPDSTLLAFEANSRWDYTGPFGSVGARWDALPQVRVGGSVTFGHKLEAHAKQGATTNYSYDMPMRIAAGASGRINDRLMVALSTTISDYTEGADYTAPGAALPTTANRTVELGGGVEWDELRSGTRVFPLRAGYHITKLPFHNASDEAATERAFSGGLGLRLAEDDYGPLAVADIGFEKGKRDGWSNSTLPGGLSENFWRFSVTMSLFGR